MIDKVYVDLYNQSYSKSLNFFKLSNDETNSLLGLKEEFLYLSRSVLNMICAIIIPLFIMTEQEDDPSSKVDFVKDFTALIILIEIDNTMA
jgi:hypothetical protein